MKTGVKIGSGFRTLFWGPLVLAHFPQVPFLGPRFGRRRRSTATTFTLELAFGTMKSGRGSKKQCQMQSDNLYDYMWHPVIFAQLQPKKRAGWFQLAACTHVRTGSCTLQQLWRPFVQGHIFYGFFRAR